MSRAGSTTPAPPTSDGSTMPRSSACAPKHGRKRQREDPRCVARARLSHEGEVPPAALARARRARGPASSTRLAPAQDAGASTVKVRVRAVGGRGTPATVRVRIPRVARARHRRTAEFASKVWPRDEAVLEIVRGRTKRSARRPARRSRHRCSSRSATSRARWRAWSPRAWSSAVDSRRRGERMVRARCWRASTATP